MVNFPTWISYYDSQSLSLLNLVISSEASICSSMASPPFGNSDHIVILVLIIFSSNSQLYGLLHRIPYDCSCADWDDCCGHLRNVPWDCILVLLLLVNFVSGFRLKLTYISFIVSVSSSLAHLYCFQLLVQFQYFIEITFSICANSINLLNLN